MRREPNDFKDKYKKKKKKKATKKVKPAPANGESAAADGEVASAQPSSGRVRRRDKLLQSLTALVGAKSGDDARARAESHAAGHSSGNGTSGISTIEEEEEEEEDEEVAEQRRLAAKRSEAADRIFAALNSGPPPLPGTPARSVASTTSSRSHGPSTSTRPGQPGAAGGGPAPAPVGALGLPPKARPGANRNRDGPPPAASARFAAMSAAAAAAASGHPQHGVPGRGPASGNRTGKGRGAAAGSPSPWADPGAHVIEPASTQTSAGRGSSQGRRPQHVRYASLDEAAAAVLQRAGSFSHPASTVDPRARLASPAASGFSLQFAGARPGSSLVPESPRLGTAQSRGMLSSRGSMRSNIEDDLVSEADQESVIGYDDDTGFPLLSGGTAHVLVIPDEGEAVHGKIDTRYVEAERPLDLSHFRRVLSFVYGDEPSPMDGLKIREVDKIMLAVHGMEGLVTDDEGGEGSSEESEGEDEGDDDEEGGSEEEEEEESEEESEEEGSEEEEEERGKPEAGGAKKGLQEEAIDPRIRDPLLREILTQELLKFLADSTQTKQAQPQTQANPRGQPRARPATADGRFHGTTGYGAVPSRSGKGQPSAEGGEGHAGGAGSQLSVSAKEARDLGGAGEGEGSSGEAFLEASGRGQGAGNGSKGKGEGEGEGGSEGRHRRGGSLDLRTEISKLSGEDALRILMSARESFQRTVEEQAHVPKGRGHVRASSLLAGKALETNLVRGITRVYSQQSICSSIAEDDEEGYAPGLAQGPAEWGAQHTRRHGGHGGAKKGALHGHRMGQIQESGAESDATWEMEGEWERERERGPEGGVAQREERGHGWENGGWEREEERERGRGWEGEAQGKGGHSWERAHHRHAPAPGPESGPEPTGLSSEEELNGRRPTKPASSGREQPWVQQQAHPGVPQAGRTQQGRSKEPPAATWPPEDGKGRQGSAKQHSDKSMQYSDNNMQYNDRSVQYSDRNVQYNDRNLQYSDRNAQYNDSEQPHGGTGQHRSTRQHDEYDSEQRGMFQGQNRAVEREQSGRGAHGGRRGEERDWANEWRGGSRPQSTHGDFGGSSRTARGTPPNVAGNGVYQQGGYGFEDSGDGWGAGGDSEQLQLRTPSDGHWDSEEASGSESHWFLSSGSNSSKSNSTKSNATRSSSNKSSIREWDAAGGAPADSHWAASGQGQGAPPEWPQEARQGPWPKSPHGVDVQPAHTGGANGVPRQRGQTSSREWPQGAQREDWGWGGAEGQMGAREWPEQGGSHRAPGAPQAAWPGQAVGARSNGGWEGGQPGNGFNGPPEDYRNSSASVPVHRNYTNLSPENISAPQGHMPRHKASYSDHGSQPMNGGHYTDQVPHHRSTYSDQRGYG